MRDGCSSRRRSSTPATDGPSPVCRAPSISPGDTSGRNRRKRVSIEPWNSHWRASSTTAWTRAAFRNSVTRIKKHRDASLAAYEQAIDLNPNDADILADMAIATRASGDTQRTMELIRRAMRLNPLQPDTCLWVLGETYFDLGDYEQAVGTLLKMHNQSEGHRLLAASYAHLGKLEEARYHAQCVLACAELSHAYPAARPHDARQSAVTLVTSARSW